MMKTFWKRIWISQNNSHPTNYTANPSHSDNYMTLKTPVKFISLQQEHLPKMLELFLHKPITCKIWVCKQRWISVSREMRLFPPTHPLAVLCLMHQQGFFFRLQHGCVNMYFAQFSWETSPAVPTVQQVKTHFFCFLSLISPLICQIPQHSQHSHLPSRPAGWQQDSQAMQGLNKQHLAQVMFLHKHMGFSSQIGTDKPMADD